MNVQLLLLLIVFTIISWLIYNRDLMAPPVILGFIFSFIMYLSLFVDPAWDFHIGKETFTILAVGIGSVNVGCIICRIASTVVNKNAYGFLENELQTIRFHHFKVFFVMITIIFVISSIGILNQARVLIGSGELSNLIYAYRINSLAGTSNLPSIISNLILINYAIGYMILYIIINNWIVSSKIDKKMVILVAYPAITSLLQGARGNLVHYFLFGIVVFYYFYMIKDAKKHIDVKLIVNIILALSIAVFLFYILKNALGRQNQTKFLEYIGGLLCAPVKLLDVYVKEEHSTSSIWGLESFTNLILAVSRWQGIPGIRYGYYANFRVINGIGFGNVYTAFRAYYADFRMNGVIILSTIIGLIVGNSYERLRRKEISRIINFNLFFYAYFVYGIAMMFYSNTFYEYIANISFIKIITVWILVNSIFIKRKIRIKI